MKPQAAPSFTPGLLNDLIDFRNTIQTVYHRTPADQKLLYLVSGSGLPGIYNLGGDLGYFAQHIRSKDRERLRRYAHDCIDLMYSCASSLGLPIILISLVQGDALGAALRSHFHRTSSSRNAPPSSAFQKSSSTCSPEWGPTASCRANWTPPAPCG